MTSEVRINNTLLADMDGVSSSEGAAASGAKGAPMPGAGQNPPHLDASFSHLLTLPTLAAPTGPLDLESLVDSLSFESRRAACRQGLDSIDANARQQKTANEKMIQEMRSNLAKMDEAKRLQALMKFLGIFALVVSAIVTVATLGAAGPVMGCISMVLLANSILSTASDGKYGIGALFAKLGKACGMDENSSQILGIVMEVVIALATMGAGIAVSLRASAAAAGKIGGSLSGKLGKGAEIAATTAQQSAAKAATEAAKNTSLQLVKNLNKFAGQAAKNTFRLSQGLVAASEAAKTAAGSGIGMMRLPEAISRIFTRAGLIAQISGGVISGGLMVAQGTAGVKNAYATSEAIDTAANARKIEALLTRLREYAEMERAMVKLELERCTSLMTAVINIVNNNNEALQRVVTTTRSMA